MEKRIDLEGEVISEVEMNLCDSSFTIQNEEQNYTVAASEMQAVKDYLFVRKGQKIKITGTVSNNLIKSESAKISLKSIL